MTTSPITDVYVVFKTHLDLGFTDYARVVRQHYHQVMIPQAIDTARALKTYDREERFVWTTGSWLITDYLENATAAERANFEQALVEGDLVWHGLPFSLHSELLDADLFRYGLSLSKRLDERFGRQTIAAKMSDVPGHSRAIVPLLAEAGISFLHIGINSMAAPVDAPPLFRWHDPSGAEIIVMYQKESYGGIQEVALNQTALYFVNGGDNTNPPTVQDVRHMFLQIRGRYPNARVRVGSMDDFARALLPYRDQLPVITEEIGDTWIHGGGTDTAKIAQYRALNRARQEYKRTYPNAVSLPAFERVSRSLLLVAEHTWGMDEKLHLADSRQYTHKELEEVRHLPRFRDFAASWEEQREYVRTALVNALALPNADVFLDRWNETKPRFIPVISQTIPKLIETQHFRISVDPASGSICRLVDSKGYVWADESHRLGEIAYQLYDAQDFARYMAPPRRLTSNEWWAVDDYSKPGIERYNIHHAITIPKVVDQAVRMLDDGIQIIFHLAWDKQQDLSLDGAPQRMQLIWYFPNQSPTIELTLSWFDKPATRLPEALWCSFVPCCKSEGTWSIEKIGSQIDPSQVRSHGNRLVHAVSGAVCYQDSERLWELESIDAPLVALGQRYLLPSSDDLPDMSGGVHVNMLNNLWGTNFPMWYEDDAQCRFVLRCGTTESPSK